MSEDKDCKEWFKTLLDDGKLREAQKHNPNGAPRSMQDVERL